MLRVRLFCLLAVVCTGEAVAQTIAKAELPDVRIGDIAVYQSTNLKNGEVERLNEITVEQVTDKFIVTRSGTIVRKYTREWNLLESAPEGTVDDTAQPHLPHYRFPLETGNQWNSIVIVRSLKDSIVNRHHWNATVLGTEEVTVPAGTYQTFKLQAESWYMGKRRAQAWNGWRRVTYWYAPAISRLVREDFEETTPFYDYHQKMELIAFRRAAERQQSSGHQSAPPQQP